MCGISLLLKSIQIKDVNLLHGTQQQNDDSKQQQLECFNDLTDYLSRRGPDCMKSHNIKISKTTSLSLIASVLHLRGTQINAQPMIDDKSGNVLLWNGEVFDGLNVGKNENDSIKVLQALNVSIFSIFQVHGPFAFIFYDFASMQIWFGRDCFGRRSLVFCYDEKTEIFALSSIAYKKGGMQWNELTNSGIFCLDLHKKQVFNYLWPEKRQNFDNLFLSPLNSVSYNEVINAFLNILMDSLRKRVQIPLKSPKHKYLQSAINEWSDSCFFDANCTQIDINQSGKCANFGLLYSGGIDSQILAALMDKVLDENECIDLINVSCGDVPSLSPDRLTAINGYLELQRCINSKKGRWRLIKVDVGYNEICNAKQRIFSLIYPRSTIMDFNIGTILYFGSRAIGKVKQSNYEWIDRNELIRYSEIECKLKQKYDKKIKNMDIESMISKQIKNEFANDQSPKYEKHKKKKKRAKMLKKEICDKVKNEIYGISKEQNDKNENDGNAKDHFSYICGARILFSGFGADELMAGYGRHRTSFKKGGCEQLRAELNKDFERIYRRNLGRDDRLISDNGRECRWPFLDERLVSFIKALPLSFVCDLNQEKGIGDKKILRDAAKKIGLKTSWSLIKRAIQFGTRIANNKVAGYAKLKKETHTNELINYDIYKQQTQQNNVQIDEKLTKKYNKQNGKKGFE